MEHKKRMAGARRLLLLQHKPFSFLSPSTSPKGSKHFAIDLLTSKNCASQSPWLMAKGRGASGGAADSERRLEPRHIPGLVCIGRLDADSTGVMLWTDDVLLAKCIASPDSHV